MIDPETGIDVEELKPPPTARYTVTCAVCSWGRSATFVLDGVDEWPIPPGEEEVVATWKRGVRRRTMLHSLHGDGWRRRSGSWFCPQHNPWTESDG